MCLSIFTRSRWQVCLWRNPNCLLTSTRGTDIKFLMRWRMKKFCKQWRSKMVCQLKRTDMWEVAGNSRFPNDWDSQSMPNFRKTLSPFRMSSHWLLTTRKFQFRNRSISRESSQACTPPETSSIQRSLASPKTQGAAASWRKPEPVALSETPVIRWKRNGVSSVRSRRFTATTQ